MGDLVSDLFAVTLKDRGGDLARWVGYWFDGLPACVRVLRF